MKKLFILALLSTALLSGCGSMSRAIKDWESDLVGINRTITVYGMDGKPIKTYSGVIDIAPSEEVGSNKVKFEVNGKRIIIWNAFVVAEEN